MEKRDGFLKHQIISFGYAIEGIIFSFGNGLHFKFHILATVLVVFLGLIYSINSTEWLILILISAAVISAEAINTAIEQTCNILESQDHHAVKIAKHCAAGGVLILSMAALIIGAIIFIPKIFG